MFSSLGCWHWAVVITTALAGMSTWGVLSSSQLPRIIPLTLLMTLGTVFAIAAETDQEGRQAPTGSGNKPVMCITTTIGTGVMACFTIIRMTSRYWRTKDSVSNGV